MPPAQHTQPTGFQGHLSESLSLTSGKRREMPWIFLQTFHSACTTCLLHSKLLDALWGFPPLDELMGSLLPPALTAGHWRAFPASLHIIHPRQGGSVYHTRGDRVRVPGARHRGQQEREGWGRPGLGALPGDGGSASGAGGGRCSRYLHPSPGKLFSSGHRSVSRSPWR